jgi:hypothetical protein
MKLILIALALVFATAPAAAQQRQPQQQVSPAAFFGTWSGGGVAENRDSIYFNMTARDIDVTIRPVDNGFTVSWTTIIRQGGNVQNPNQRRRETVRTLRPAPQGRVWRCVESGDPFTPGKEACWARITGRTLTLYQMTIRADGAYELEQYDRTLTDTGMDLKFTRLRDREPVRTVTGKLVKTAQ